MNLRQLEHLLAVADSGSFSRAAEQQHITQSALSRSIQALEAQLDERLIDRVGKSNELTPFGHAVAARARRLVLDAAELVRSAELLRKGDLGALRIGLGSGPSAILMRPFLAYMAHAHPGVELSISPGATELQVPQLRQREFDALVVDIHRITPAPDLVIEDMGQMRGGFICRAGHPLRASGAPVTFEELRRYPLASIPVSATVARALIARYGPSADPQASVTLRCDDLQGLLDAVQASDAVCLCIVGAAMTRIRAGQLVELTTVPALNVNGHFAFVTLAGRTAVPALAIFRRFVAEHLRE